jgi:diguanylate cyclase (GGDEF)-like protein/PAS domain S-box-containing protein
LTTPAATILIVDDEPQNCKLLEVMLRRDGYATVAVANGEAALAAIAQRAPDLILLDIKLPGMDGYQVASLLKGDPGTSNIPIIMVTVLVDRDARMSAFKAGVEELVTKPIDPSELSLRVRNLLRLKAYGDLLQDRGFNLEQQVQARTTDLQNAVEDLRRSESLKGAILKSSLDCIITIDHEGKVFEFNPAAEATFGLTRAQALGKDMVELVVPPRQREAHRRGFAHFLATGEGPILGKRLELEAIRADGSEFPIELAITAIGETATPMFTGFIRDITTRKRTELELQRFRAAMDISADAIVLVDRASMRYIDVNQTLCDMAGLTRQELMGMAPMDLMDGNRETLERDYDAVIADSNSAAAKVEGQFHRKDGSTVLIETRRRALRTENGWVIVGIVRDVTVQRQAAVRITRLNRVYAVLSGINTLIVRVHDREELFREACRVAVEQGQFKMAWIGVVNRSAMKIEPVASAGSKPEYLAYIKDRFSLIEDPTVDLAMTARAVRERKAFFSNDTQNDPAITFKKEHLETGTRSLASIPLLIADESVGVLCLYTEEAGFFDAEEINLLVELASNVAFAVDHIDRAGKLGRVTRVNAMLSDINGAIVRIRDRQELFQEACRIAVQTGGLAFVWLCEVDEAGERLRPVASAGQDDGFLELISGRFSLRDDAPEGHGIGARCARDGRNLVVNDIQAANLKYSKAHAERGIKSAAALPLFVAGRMVGVLGLHAGEIGFFDEDEMKLLTEMAANIAFALEHIEKEEKVLRLTRVNAMLSDINGAIVRIRGRQELFEEACRIAVETGGLPVAWLGLTDAAETQLQLVASAGRDDGFLETIRKRLAMRGETAESQSLSWRVIQERHALVVNNVAADTVLRSRKAFADHGIKAVAIFPLVVAGRVVGTFALHSEQAGFFDGDEMRLLNEVAANIAFALEHIEKEEKVRRLTRVYAVLSGINTLIVRVRSREELFREACRIAVDVGGFPRAWIGMVEPGSRQFSMVAAHGGDPQFYQDLEKELARRVPAGRGHVVQALATRQPVVVNNIPGDPDVLLKDHLAASSARSLAILPLIVSGQALGVFTLNADSLGYFDEEEMKLLAELAGDIAFAVGHIERTDKLERLTRVNAVLSGINGAIVRIRDRQALTEEVCRIAVEIGGLPFAWMSEVDEKENRMRPVASAGGDGALLDLVRVRLSLRDDAPEGHGLSARSIREKRALVANDVDTSEDARHKQLYAAIGVKSIAALPLLAGNRAIGGLILHSAEAGFFDTDEMRLLNEVAANVAFALEHIEKAEKLDRMTRVNAILSGINGAIVHIRDRKQLFQKVCRIAGETGGLPFCWLCVVDATGSRLEPVGYAGPDDGFLEMIADRLSLQDDAPGGYGISARSVREKRAIRVSDVAASDRIRHKKPYADRGIRSSAAFPLIIAGRAIGSFSLNSTEVGFFDDEEMALLNEVAGNIAFALEHIEKEEKVSRLTRVYAVSSGITSLIVHVDNREELFREACRIAVADGKFAMAWVGAFDPATQDVTPVAWAGEAAEELTKAKSSARDDTPRGTGAVGMAIRARSPIFNNNILAQSFGGPRLQEIIRLGFQSQITLPLYENQAIVATLTLYTKERGYFDDAEVRLLTDLAADISFALENISRQHKLDYLAFYDELTGLANRSLFLERLAQHMRAAVSGGHKLALFFLDLERFRNINDSLGRPAGDALLKQVAEWLTRSVRDPNLLARLGADHFAIVLPEVNQDGDVARLLDKRLREFVEHPFRLNDTEIRVATKVGVALFPNDGTDADTLLKNAEAALKQAKERGDRILFYTQTMNEAVAGNLTLENQLRRALENEEFVLHFQPKVSLNTGKLTSAEALIRWNDPLTGLVPPGRFIPILEETGLIHDVGRWALRTAIAQSMRWRGAGLPAVRIAVNVSPLQLRSPGFIPELRQAISIDAHAAEGLELEITESVIMEDIKNCIAVLRAIRAMGLSVAIDDFGTGFSSLGYLAKLPVDTRKIDRSFVTEMTTGPDGMALVSMIINLAHSLKLNVVAEGVETEEQSRLLRLLHCDQMQGYLFSKPVPADEFEARFLAEPALA